MNPRIKQLAEQALKHPDNDNDGLTVFDNDELEKFVELIVKECAKVLTQHGTYFSGEGEPYHYAASLIEDHFGVES